MTRTHPIPDTPHILSRLTALTTTPAETPRVMCGAHAYYRLTEGIDYALTPQRVIDIGTRFMPIAALGRKPQTIEDAEAIQLTYIDTADRYARYTRTSQRTNLLTDPTHTDSHGALCTYLAGFVTDYASDPQGNITRILLANPHTLTDPTQAFSGHTPPIDSHIWLMRNNLTHDPNLITPNDRKRLDLDPNRREGRLHLGEYLIIAGRITRYQDKHNNTRIGIKEWTPITAWLLYAQRYADGRRILRSTPRHLVTNLTIIDFTTPQDTWTDPAILQHQLTQTKKHHPDITQNNHTLLAA